jgi:hypothetical protein
VEAHDVADLGDHEHCDVAADAADLAEHLDVGVLLGAGLDLARGEVDLAAEVGDQRECAVEPPARAVVQLERLEEAQAAGAEHVAEGPRDALLGEDRPGAVLERRTHPRKRDAVAQQITQLTQLARRDVGLGQQPGAQQLRERPGVHGIVLDSGRGDRLRPERRL